MGISDESVIFLDIDGVLNRHEFNRLACSNLIERDLVAILNHILIETDARIVLSSAWRYLVHRGEMEVAGIDWLLRSHGVAAGKSYPDLRVVGVTRADTMVPFYNGTTHSYWPVENERGKQIQEWLDSSRFKGPYVVIDDGGYKPDNRDWTDLGLIAARHPIVWTHSKLGLTYENADRAIKILKNDPNVERYVPSPHMGSTSPLRLLSGDGE